MSSENYMGVIYRVTFDEIRAAHNELGSEYTH